MMMKTCRIPLLVGFLLATPFAVAAAGTDLRFPWDNRPEQCFTGTAKSPACELDSWPTIPLAFERLRILWKAEQFALLERALLELSLATTVYANGYPRYDSPYTMLSDDVGSQDGPKLERWKAAVPDSLFVTIAASILERKLAWAIRGSGYAPTVNDDAWKLFDGHLQASESLLLGAPSEARRLAAWHHALLTVVLPQRKPKSDPAKVFAAAVERWPNNYAVYESMAVYTLPKWGGSWPTLEHFIAASSAAIPNDGDTLYFRLYYRLRNEPRGASLKVTEVGVDYPHLRRSGIELVRRWPTVHGFKAALTSFACAFQDRQTYLEYVGQLPATELSSKDWVPGYTYEYCSHWAQSPSPQTPEGKAKAPPRPDSG
ncbi:MAG TPA: hypothetical protein VMB75_08190, partial [Rhodocyclaceae bacterium]|nr:hypothetical protein [Rhodocyclaceae bacterium]